MLLNDVLNSKFFGRIPQKGYIYAIFKAGVIFEKYELNPKGFKFSGDAAFEGSPLRELHCFDENTEYRLIVQDDSPCACPIEKVVSAEEEKGIPAELLLNDEMLLEERYTKCGVKKITIVNRYSYSFFDTLQLDDYRMTV